VAKLFNRAKMSVSGTPGTGTITLGSAAVGFQSFAAAGVANNDVVSYVIEDGAEWEIGQGTYTSSGTTLARTTVLASSNAGNKISVTSTAIVFLSVLASDISTASIGYAIDGGGAAIATGIAGTGIRAPFACTINSVTLLADVTGSIVIDIWKDTYANFPPTVADTICASAKPTISSGVKSEDTTLTGWTKTIAAGDVLYFNVDSCTAITNVSVILNVTRN
jgi:hypothetical protein